eukprot:scaffold270038_cov13-Tisochrysis_lutea.AAC.1
MQATACINFMVVCSTGFQLNNSAGQQTSDNTGSSSFDEMKEGSCPSVTACLKDAPRLWRIPL